MFLGGKNQYCENDYTTKCHLQIQCYPYQITNGFFHQTGMKIFTIHMETQKTPNSKKTVLRKKNAAAAAKLLQSCPTLRSHRWGPTRLPRPWDSPGMNTGVGCHFLLQCIKVKSESEVAQSCPTLSAPWTAAHQAPPSMGFPRQEYWSGVPLELEESTVLTSDYTPELHSSRQYGTGTKTEIWMNGTK